MRFLTTAAALTAALSFSGTSSATSLILSESNTNPDAGVNQIIGLGSSSSLYVWIEADVNQSITAARMNITSSNAGVLEANTHSIFNPLVSLGGSQGDQRRWSAADGSDTAGGVVSLGDLVVESAAVALPVGSSATAPGFGIIQGAADQGTVVGNRFLHSVITFTGTAVGTTTVATETLENDWLLDGLFDDITGLQFSSGTVEVRTPGDANGDGNVSLADLDILGQNFGGSGGYGDGDFNGDGSISLADLDILGQNFGTTTAPAPASLAAVPEPTSLALLGLGGLLVARRRRA